MGPPEPLTARPGLAHGWSVGGSTDGAVGGGDLWSSASWLRVTRAEPGLEASYLRDGGGGLLPCYLWDGRESLLMHYCDPTRIFLTPAERAAWPPERWFPMLVVGPLGGYTTALDGTGLAFSTTAGLAGALAAVHDLATRAGARSIALMYLTPGAAVRLRPLLAAHVPALLCSATCSLTVRWTSFEQYLTELSHGRRSMVHRDLRRFAAGGCSVRDQRLADVCDEAAGLLAALQRRYGHNVSVHEAVRHLRRVAEELDERSVVFTARRGGRLAGFALFLRWGDRLHAHKVGFDEELARAAGAYFQLTFYSPIRLAIERGLAAIDLGLGSWRPKLLRGASLQPRYAVIGPPVGDGGRWRRATDAWNDVQRQVWEELYGGLARPADLDGWPEL